MRPGGWCESRDADAGAAGGVQARGSEEAGGGGAEEVGGGEAEEAGGGVQARGSGGSCESRDAEPGAAENSS
eukprot:61712-Hanusia_phi.AAC.1